MCSLIFPPFSSVEPDRSGNNHAMKCKIGENNGSRPISWQYLYLFLCMLDNHSKHLGQVPGQVPHPPSYNSVENTLCQLWCQTLGDNTVAFPLVFHYLQGSVRPKKTKPNEVSRIWIHWSVLTGVCTMHFAYFIVLLYFSFSSQLCFLTLWIDCITFYQFFWLLEQKLIITFQMK